MYFFCKVCDSVSRHIYIYFKCEVTLVMAIVLCSFGIYRMFSDKLENTTKTLFCLSQPFMAIIIANAIFGSVDSIVWQHTYMTREFDYGLVASTLHECSHPEHCIVAKNDKKVIFGGQ